MSGNLLAGIAAGNHRPCYPLVWAALLRPAGWRAVSDARRKQARSQRAGGGG